MINLNFSKITVSDALSILKFFDEKWIKSYYNFLFEYFNNNQIKISTSGTTGKRKSITVTKLEMQKSAEATLSYFNLKENNSTLLALSCDFVAGKMMLVRALEGKLNLFLAKPCSDPSNYFPIEYDFVPLVPMQVKNIITSNKINKIKQLLIGGGKVNDEMITQIKKFKTEVFESFAMTETLTHFAIKKISPNYTDWFKTINGFEIDINQEGELIINNLAKNHILKTKDLIEKKNNLEFRWLGRSDNVINSGGIKIIPEEIEQKIVQLISGKFILTGVADEKLGERIVLLTEEPLTLELKKINESLSEYEKIKRNIVIGAFPLTESGKIKRKELQKIVNV